MCDIECLFNIFAWFLLHSKSNKTNYCIDVVGREMRCAKLHIKLGLMFYVTILQGDFIVFMWTENPFLSLCSILNITEAVGNHMVGLNGNSVSLTASALAISVVNIDQENFHNLTFGVSSTNKSINPEVSTITFDSWRSVYILKVTQWSNLMLFFYRFISTRSLLMVQWPSFLFPLKYKTDSQS